MRTKNFCDVSLGIQASLNLHQVTSSLEVDLQPHQYTSPTMWRSLIHAVLGVARMDSTVNSSLSIVSLIQHIHPTMVPVEMFPLLFFAMLATVLSQIHPPHRPLGFKYTKGEEHAKIKVEMFMDLLCQESAAAWRVVRDVFSSLDPGTVCLTVHLYPLPYHSYSYCLTKATFFVHYLSRGTKTFDWIELILTRQSEFSNQVIIEKIPAEMYPILIELGRMVGVNSEDMDEDVKNSTRGFHTYAKKVFEYGALRGVASTPTFFVNGVMQGQILPSWTGQDWLRFLDPLLKPDVFDKENSGLDEFDNEQTTDI